MNWAPGLVESANTQPRTRSDSVNDPPRKPTQPLSPRLHHLCDVLNAKGAGMSLQALRIRLGDTSQKAFDQLVKRAVAKGILWQDLEYPSFLRLMLTPDYWGRTSQQASPGAPSESPDDPASSSLKNPASPAKSAAASFAPDPPASTKPIPRVTSKPSQFLNKVAGQMLVQLACLLRPRAARPTRRRTSGPPRPYIAPLSHPSRA
ncbi:hypothetical protein JCM10295v2_002669 [Rhodotorula toruloides]